MTRNKITLHYFQQEACQALNKGMDKQIDTHHGSFNRPYALMMTATGKSYVTAALANRYANNDERVVITVPRLELVQQNYEAAYQYLDKKSDIGIVCGQLHKRQINKQVIIAMTSSLVNLRTKIGTVDRLIQDECHRMAWRVDGMKPSMGQKIYTSLWRINQNIKSCGVTATDYRMDQGSLLDTSHKTLAFFTEKVYDTSVHPGIPRLIRDGFLSHIETLNTPVQVDLTGVKMSGLDFNKDAAGLKFDAIIEDAVNDMRNQFDEHNINTAIIFVSNLANAEHVLNAWGDKSTMRIVCDNPRLCTKAQRKAAIDWIKNGSGRRYIICVDILAEGFDYKALQCVVLLRATTSPGLLVQFVGRIFRTHDSKEHGFLIDYGTNLSRLTNGGIEEIIVPKVKKKKSEAPRKQCTAILDETIVFEGLTYRKGDMCAYPNILSAKRCKCCQAEFISVNEDGLYAMRTKAQALAIKKEKEENKQFYEVSSVAYSMHKKGEKEMVKCDYYGMNYMDQEEYIASEFLFALPDAPAKVKMRLKNTKEDLKKIYSFQGGMCAKNVLFLFENYYSQFFREVKIIQTKRNPNGFKSVIWYGFLSDTIKDLEQLKVMGKDKGMDVLRKVQDDCLLHELFKRIAPECIVDNRVVVKGIWD